jgi:nicotinamide-nucleotide amidase
VTLVPSSGDGAAASLAAEVHTLLLSRGETVAVAESLTGGALGAALTAVPGVSATFRGGIVAYATELKAELLGVDRDLLAQFGPVHQLVAARMAAGVRRRLGATYGLATTGVAGPDPQDGHLPGEVYIGMARGGRGLLLTQSLHLTGDRAAIRAGAVQAALEGLRDLLVRGNAPA